MSDLISSYDKHADVLYLSLGEPTAAICTAGPGGLLLRHAADDGRPCGVTVMNFSEWWRSDRLRLLATIGAFLDVRRADLEEALARPAPEEPRHE